MKENVGNPERKEMTSRGDFQRSNGVSGVGWRGQSNRCVAWHNVSPLISA